MKKQPLAEVFGFPVANSSRQAERYRKHKLCPFNNRIPNCTKDKASDPLGVCSIYHGEEPVITCPVRFRQDWIVAEDAAGFFFEEGASWTSLTEVRLKDKHGQSAGNIDVVLVAYDHIGKYIDYGLIEFQMLELEEGWLVPFEYYLLDSEFVEKIAPFVRFNRKIAIAVNEGMWPKLKKLESVASDSHKAQVMWIVYGLRSCDNIYKLSKEHVVYTEYVPTWFAEKSIEINDEAMVWRVFEENLISNTVE